MTPCTRILSWLPAFVGDELDVAAAATVRQHLRDCVDCRRQAASLQQARNALQRLAAAPAPGVDEAWFASLQQDVVAAVARQAERPAPRWWEAMRWPVSVAAAAALFSCGWWLVRDDGPESLLQRPPLVTTVGHAGASLGPAKAVPWSGERLQMQPLGDEGGVESGFGPGMMGRYQLRTLEGREWPAGWPLPEAGLGAGAGAAGETPLAPGRSTHGR
jgi:anti-sigma factor RsiW